MNRESKVDLDTGHDYDGIHEYDNPLPNWWLAIFFGTVLFSYAYWIHYHVANTGSGLIAEYDADQAEAARNAASSKPLSDEVLSALVKDPQTVTAGEKVFAQNCASCHGERAEGKIGPNLTDAFWLHGNRPTEIFKTVSGGVVEKGMPAWQPVLGAERVRAVVAYVMTRQRLNLPGKEPQGERVGDK
jgi:cytochrome c oxidase cbb3-type subunit 3